MSRKQLRAVLYGGSGFAGAELARRLLVHPDVELTRVHSIDHVGELLSAAHPHLEGATELRFEPMPERGAPVDADIVLLGLPHTASIDVVDGLLAGRTKIIDLSGAFRLRDLVAYERFYGAAHPRPELLPEFVYGLPELNRAAISGARFVASPGCFATAIELALLPLARAGLLADHVEVVGITGSSGSGVTPTVTTHHPTRAQNLRTYKPLEHQHVPEIERVLGEVRGRAVRVNFVPVSGPLTRGIFVTAFVRVAESVDAAAVSRIYREAYAGEPFVRVPAKRLPEVVAVSGSNYAEASAVVGPVENVSRTVTAFGALDNLIKGGAGQAIQNMNLMLGLPEKTALEDVGGYP